MADARPGIRLTRYTNGKHVLDSVAVPTGADSLSRPWRTASHVRSDDGLLNALDGAVPAAA